MRVAEIIVYVEGPSDKGAMEALLDPLIQQKQKEGYCPSVALIG